MHRTALYEAIRSIDEAAVRLWPPDHARRLAGIRAQLCFLMREMESSRIPCRTERPTIVGDSTLIQQDFEAAE